MYFEGRQLKPYANPVTPADLIVGEAYFSVGFSDQTKLIPLVETMLFVGKDFDERDKGEYYFQDYYSYHNGERLESSETLKYAIIHRYLEHEIQGIYKFEDALDILLECSLRRQKIASE